MIEKYSLTLTNDFIDYCKLNGIEDPVKFAEKIFNESFMKIKYPVIRKNVPPPPKPQEPRTVKEGEQPKPIKKEEKTDLYDE